MVENGERRKWTGVGNERTEVEKGTAKRKRKGGAELWKRGAERRGGASGWIEERGRGRMAERQGRAERLEAEPEAEAGSAGRRSDVDVGVGGGSDGGGPDTAEASRLPEVAEEMKCLPAS